MVQYGLPAISNIQNLECKVNSSFFDKIEGSEIMSFKRVLRALKEFGISETEANVYVYLAKKGSKSSVELAKALQMPTKQADRTLQNLENRGLIMTSLSHSIVFSALPFEKVLECLVHIKEQKAQEINEKKIELLALWKSVEVEKEN
jgi:sugar-specific transcriptional regulator TrmB